MSNEDTKDTTTYSNVVRYGNMVAGAVAAGHGILSGWRGAEKRTHVQLADVAVQAQIPMEWLPTPKDAAIQLGRAVQHVAGIYYEAKPTPKKYRTAADRWDSQWRLILKQEGTQPGDAYGMVALVATTYNVDGVTRIVCNPTPQESQLARAVMAEYSKRIETSEYTASDVTKWLGDTLYQRLDAVRYGGNWYVPRDTKAVAQRLLDAMRASGWGKQWVYPALPIATSAEMIVGIAISFEEEVGGLMNTLAAARKQAQDNGRKDIGMRAIESWQRKVDDVTTKARSYLKRELIDQPGFDHYMTVAGDMLVLLDTIAAENLDDVADAA